MRNISANLSEELIKWYQETSKWTYENLLKALTSSLLFVD